jgi:hypothetical protein
LHIAQRRSLLQRPQRADPRIEEKQQDQARYWSIKSWRLPARSRAVPPGRKRSKSGVRRCRYFSPCCRLHAAEARSCQFGRNWPCPSQCANIVPNGGGMSLLRTPEQLGSRK